MDAARLAHLLRLLADECDYLRDYSHGRRRCWISTLNRAGQRLRWIPGHEGIAGTLRKLKVYVAARLAIKFHETLELRTRMLPLHDKYWQTEDAMAEGNPVQALERGENVALPPVLYIQDTRDILR